MPSFPDPYKVISQSFFFRRRGNNKWPAALYDSVGTFHFRTRARLEDITCMGKIFPNTDLTGMEKAIYAKKKNSNNNNNKPTNKQTKTRNTTKYSSPFVSGKESTFLPLQDMWFEGYFAFESLLNSAHFIRRCGEQLLLQKYENSHFFKEDSSFKLTRKRCIGKNAAEYSEKFPA